MFLRLIGFFFQFVDPLFTSDEPPEPIASNIKVDDEDEPIYDASETKFDPTHLSWTDAPVKQEEIVVVSTLLVQLYLQTRNLLDAKAKIFYETRWLTCKILFVEDSLRYDTTRVIMNLTFYLRYLSTGSISILRCILKKDGRTTEIAITSYRANVK